MCCSCLADTPFSHSERLSLLLQRGKIAGSRVALLQYLCLGTQWCSKPWQWHRGHCCSQQGTRQSICPGHSTAEQRKEGGQSLDTQVAQAAPCRDLPVGTGSCPLGWVWDRSFPGFGVFCPMGWFPGRNDGSEPFNWLFLLLLSENNNSERFMFLLFFLTSVFLVMLQLLKWSFPWYDIRVNSVVELQAAELALCFLLLSSICTSY